MSEYLSFIESLRTLTDDSNYFKFLANNRSKFDPDKDSVYYSGPFWDHQEIEAAIKCLVEGKWLSSGENVMKFERRFSKRFGFAESLMVNSGSSANLVMIAALKKYFDWKDNDEIIVSVVGFPTTINPIIQNGLKPVFVDISWDDLNWNIDDLERAISPRPRAVFSSPVLGNVYDLEKVLDLCARHNLELISDNCDSLGSKWKNKFLTDYSIAASCSFYPAHHMTTMEGGMVSSKNPEVVKLARSFAWWGRACYCVGVQNLLPDGTCKKRFSNWIQDCEIPVDHKYVFENVGYNLKPLDLQGAIGNIQLEKFDAMEESRRRNKDRIDGIFASVQGIRLLKEHENARTSWFGVPLICESSQLKRNLVSFLEANRIQTRNYFAGNILQQPAYREYGNYRDFQNASMVLERVFFVGCSPTITSEMIDYVESVVKKYIDEN